MKHKQRGFTLIELLVVLAIIGILAVLAAPSFGRMMARNEIQTALGEWRNSFYLAQREAIRLKHRVQICPSTDGANCTGGNDFSQGWVVRDNTSRRLIQDFPPTPAMENGTISLNLNVGNGVTLNFLRNGRLPSNFAGGNLTATHSRYADVDTQINISRGGRITGQ